MKVAGIKMTDPWASRALRSKGVEIERVASAPVETVVQMERVAFEHHGSEKNHRPLLHLTGELVAILPDAPLPYGIEEVTFRSGLGPTVDAFYEFDDTQLTELVSKGYFTEGFEPPANMAGIPWELPTTIDALILAPEDDGDAPVVFVTIHGQTELALNAENSGYDLAEYFASTLTPEAVQEQALNAPQRGVPTRSGEIDDIFVTDSFTAPDTDVQRNSGTRFAQMAPKIPNGDFPVVRASIFEDLMTEFEQTRAAEAAELASRPVEYDPNSVEGVYQTRIAPGVTQALDVQDENESAPEAEAENTIEESTPVETDDAAETFLKDEEPEEGLLDLYDGEEDEELDVVPVATKPTEKEIWEPKQDLSDLNETSTDTDTDTGHSASDQRNRRVHRTQEHERALARENDDVESGPELG